MGGGLEAPVAEERELVDIAIVERQVVPRVLLHAVARDDGGAVAARERDGAGAGRDVELGPEAEAVGEHSGEEAGRHARDLFALGEREFVFHEHPDGERSLLCHAARRDVEPPTALHHLRVLDLVRGRPRVRLPGARLLLEPQNHRDRGALLRGDDLRRAEDCGGVNVLRDERERSVVVRDPRSVEAPLW